MAEYAIAILHIMEAIGEVKIIYSVYCEDVLDSSLQGNSGKTRPLEMPQRVGLECLGHKGKRGSHSSLCEQEIRLTASAWCASGCMEADQG